MKGISITDHKEPGYKTIWSFGEWRIAINNDSPESRRKEIKVMSRHLESDETFTLLQGNANLYYSEDENEPKSIKKQTLSLFETVVVHAGTWHVIETFEDARIIIAENSDTGVANSEKYSISEFKLPD